MEHYKLFIDGEFVDASDGKTFETLDPGTGMPVATVAQAGARGSRGRHPGRPTGV